MSSEGERSDLRRRREQLVQELSQMHWDLGGLTYEMAIRDHFRLEVLLRRSALMQERDMELAEVERKLAALGEPAQSPPQGTPPSAPPTSGEPRPSPAGASQSAPAGAASAFGPPEKGLVGAARSRLRSLRLPAALVVAFLAFGVLIGHVTRTSTGRPVADRLLLPQTPAPSSSSTGGTPPASEEQETPESKGKSEPSKSESSQNSGTSSSSGSSTSSGNSSPSSPSPSNCSSKKLPAIKHVFVVMLSDEPYASSFGPASSARYLTGTLEKQGALLERYYAVAHEGLADGIALLSGQGPTEATAANCPVYEPIAKAQSGSDGQLLGKGCTYPSSTPTLMSQLASKHLHWRAYIEGLGGGGGVASSVGRSASLQACAHPAAGAADPSASTSAAYETWRNPFVYFSSVLSKGCSSDDVGIGALSKDLSSASRTPSFSYIAPGPCSDGSPAACVAGKSAGMGPADGFLKRVVPKILASSAYKQNGLLVITSDEAPSSGELADSSSCCGQPTFPNLPAPSSSAAALGASGGGQVGALLLSPFLKHRGSLVQDATNHFSLLATIEQLFGLPKLGYAGLSEVKPFSASLFSGG
jgi:phosphatidylinositol-3-phosphatase